QMTDSRPRPPTPVGLSEQARQYLQIPDPFGDAKAPTDLDDVDGWLSYIDTRSAVLEKNLTGRLPAELTLCTARSTWMVSAPTWFDGMTSPKGRTRLSTSKSTAGHSSWAEVTSASLGQCRGARTGHDHLGGRLSHAASPPLSGRPRRLPGHIPQGAGRPL